VEAVGADDEIKGLFAAAGEANVAPAIPAPETRTFLPIAIFWRAR
jgi:hypothetical protein